MDYALGSEAHTWTDYHTLEYGCKVDVPDLIKERIERVASANDIDSEVYVKPIYDKDYQYKLRGYVYLTDSELFNILTAHNKNGSPLERRELVIDEEDDGSDWGSGEWVVKRQPLIVSPSDLVVQVPQAELPDGYGDSGIVDGVAEVSFRLRGLVKKDVPSDSLSHIIYAEIPDDVSYEEIEEAVDPYIRWKNIIDQGRDVDYPFISKDVWTLRGREKNVFIIEFKPHDEDARFLMFMIKAIWFPNEYAPPTLVSFWNRRTVLEEKAPARGKRGRGGRGGSYGPGRGGSHSSGRGGAGPRGRGGSYSSGRGKRKIQVDEFGFKTPKKR